MDAQRLRRRQIVTFTVLLAVIGSCATAFFLRLSHSRQQPVRSPRDATTDPVTASRKLPPARQGFVGSAVCAECHAEIAEKYARHPMARSLTPVAMASPIENYDQTQFSPSGPRSYRVEKTDQGIFHVESMTDLNGEQLYEQKVPVKYAVGSGQHGRAYLVQRDGMLFQSSIGWYSQGQRWDLSPGYQPLVHKRFERQVSDGCLYCHAGRMAPHPEWPDHYAEQPFLEASIGCERCHGPGEEHVHHQRSQKVSGPDLTIVNPSRLDPQRREAVCNQCHLQGEKVVPRHGRGFFDFRPGEFLDESLIILVHGLRIDEQRTTRPVSQVEQMRASRCFTASQGRMGCTSCHDPHEVVERERRDESYRDSCLKCHAERGCSLPEAERREKSAGDACTACHMPALKTRDVAHTSLTDHRILRRPDDAKIRTRLPTPDEIALFDGAERRLSQREADRARAIAIIDLATSRNDQSWAQRGELFLIPPEVAYGTIDQMIESLGDDLAAIEALGQAYLIMERPREAVRCWEAVLRRSPHSLSALVRLAIQQQSFEDWPSSLQYLDRALRLDPSSSILNGRRTYVLGQMGQYEEGISAAQRALDADPTLTQVRQWLADTHARLGNNKDSQTHRSIADRMQAAFDRAAGQ
ncbi:MAG: tetratricopeptide repeat protein [Pirellulales bacterium]